MKYTLHYSNQFQKDIKRVESQHKDMNKLKSVLDKLLDGESLPTANRDHQLKGNMKAFRECHIEPNWLLIYRVDNDKLILYAIRTGSHNQLGITSAKSSETKEIRYYRYEGLVYYEGYEITYNKKTGKEQQGPWIHGRVYHTANTEAVSREEAINHIGYKLKEDLHIRGYCRFKPNKLVEVPAPITTFQDRIENTDYCENCDGPLNDAGQCPICDLGEEDY